MPKYDWRTPLEQPLVFDEATTYTGDVRPIAHVRSYEWIHPLSDIVTALSAAGLALEWLHEHELLPYRLFPMMVPADKPGLFRLPDEEPRLALSFSLKASEARLMPAG